MGLIDNVLGARGGMGGGGGGMSPLTMALLGVLAYRTMQGKGRLADMLGHHPDGGTGVPDSGPAGAGGIFSALTRGGGLGGLLGGAGAGGMLSGGLADLMKQFQQNGQGDKVQSWVASGPNKPVAPHELEQGLGEERIQWLMQQTGLPRDQLLQGLSRELPEAVDKLTPEGRLPTEQEAHGIWTDGRA